MSVLGQVGPFAMGQVGPFTMGQVGPFAMGQVGPFAMGQVGPRGLICPGGVGQHTPYKAYAVIINALIYRNDGEICSLFFFFQGEEWVQCTQCNDWARAECTDLGKSPVYICHNCDSDTDSVYIC